MNKKLIALSVAGLLSTSVFADNYAGVSYKMVEIEAGSSSVEPSALEGKYGSFLTNNFALEGRLGFGIADDEGVDIDSLLGVFGAFHFMPKEKFSPYALIGYSRGEISAGSFSDSETDISFGFGADIAVNGDGAFNVEYVQYLDKDGVTISALSAGYVWNF
ncbi:MAG: outer membrane beta-barrel protein [Gammaproteobacteria bacterium]|nr:outer membrane beta-barrel protein [Gammaproteobacteria bacterium]